MKIVEFKYQSMHRSIIETATLGEYWTTLQERPNGIQMFADKATHSYLIPWHRIEEVTYVDSPH